MSIDITQQQPFTLEVVLAKSNTTCATLKCFNPKTSHGIYHKKNKKHIVKSLRCPKLKASHWWQVAHIRWTPTLPRSIHIFIQNNVKHIIMTIEHSKRPWALCLISYMCCPTTTCSRAPCMHTLSSTQQVCTWTKPHKNQRLWSVFSV